MNNYDAREERERARNAEDRRKRIAREEYDQRMEEAAYLRNYRHLMRFGIRDPSFPTTSIEIESRYS